MDCKAGRGGESHSLTALLQLGPGSPGARMSLAVANHYTDADQIRNIVLKQYFETYKHKQTASKN